MKKFNIIALTSLALILTACGSGSTSTTVDDAIPGDTIVDETGESMTIGKSYSMNEGETILKDSDDATLTIETEIETGITVVTLESGSASIVKN